MFWNAQKYFETYVVPVVNEVAEVTGNKCRALIAGRAAVMNSDLSNKKKRKLIDMINQTGKEWE